MSYSLPANAEKCGRCSWWGGVRELDGTKNLNILSREALCENRNATPGMANMNTEFICECPAFEVWNRLR
jgi:hypothetical protein